MFESLDEKVRGKHCDGIAGIIEEGKSIMEEDFDATVRSYDSPKNATRRRATTPRLSKSENAMSAMSSEQRLLFDSR